MKNRSARRLHVIRAGMMMSLLITSIAPIAAHAADECLTARKDTTPAGQRWHYRTDRLTKRQCWYLRAEGETPAQPAVSAPSGKAATVARASALPRSAAEAHAELSSPDGRSAGPWQSVASAQSSSTTNAADPDPQHGAAANGDPSPVVSRWPDPTAELSAPVVRPSASSFALASTTPEVTAATESDTAADAAVAPATPPRVSPPAVSVQTLVLAAFAALAFSGLTGSAIYAFGARRRPVRGMSPAAMTDLPPFDRADRAPFRLHPRSLDPADPDDLSIYRPTGSPDRGGDEIAKILVHFAHQAEAER